MVATTSSGTALVTLPTDDQILITREFNAPAALVFRAWTTPELVKRWWTAKRGEAVLVEIDLRVGGAWRYVMLVRGEFEVAFHGVYREIVPGELIVSTDIYEGAPEAPSVTTVTFAENKGRTALSILVQHENQANRDAHLNAGMEDGMQDALDLLEGLAVTLAD